jgi:hypothetical protein
MPQLSDTQWRNARALFEEEGWSQKAIADKYGVSLTTISKHKKKGGWSRDGQPDPTETGPSYADVVVSGFSDEQTIPLAEASPDAAAISELEERLAAAEERARKAEARAEEVSPTHLADLGDDYDQEAGVNAVIAYLGRDYLEEVAAKKFNRERKADGFVAIEFAEGDPRLAAAVKDLALRLWQNRSKFADESSMRTVKMAVKDPNHPTGWSLRAIPVTPTVNNEAGQPGASIWKARDKGFKLIRPYLCQLQNCWRKAAEENGQLTYSGYCSQAHAGRDVFLTGKTVGGVTTSQVGSMSQPGSGFQVSKIGTVGG